MFYNMLKMFQCHDFHVNFVFYELRTFNLISTEVLTVSNLYNSIIPNKYVQTESHQGIIVIFIKIFKCKNWLAIRYYKTI